MKFVVSRSFWTVITLLPLLAIPATAMGQEVPSECVEQGALAYENWTKVDAGGTGSLPEGVVNKDYIRCKACHGWDHRGTEGGYVRRSRKDSRPNAGLGDGDSTSRVIPTSDVTADQIMHSGTGRTYAQGTGSWVPLDDIFSADNTAANAGGYTLGNQHPDFSTGGMTAEQAGCLAEFLNFADAGPAAYFADINPDMNPVLYTIISTADGLMGENFYNANCVGCHGDPSGESPVGAPDGGILAYLASDGKFSEFSHKVRWGIPDETMTRDAMGSPTSADVADMMLWLQEEGGTGFALNPGLTGTWWNATRSGEGFVLEFGYSGDVLTLFASFYTYDDMGNQVWLTAQSTAINSTVATVDVFITSGAMWGADFDPADVVRTLWGTGTFSFPGCESSTVSLMPNAEMMAMGYTDLIYGLTRDAIVSGIACPTPTAN